LQIRFRPTGYLEEKSVTQSISTEMLSQIEQRCAAATQGPWKSLVEGRDHGSGDSFIKTGGSDIYLSGASLADLDFIAHARQDVPALVQELRALRKSSPS
jgi:hypothetical protein